MGTIPPKGTLEISGYAGHDFHAASSSEPMVLEILTTNSEELQYVFGVGDGTSFKRKRGAFSTGFGNFPGGSQECSDEADLQDCQVLSCLSSHTSISSLRPLFLYSTLCDPGVGESGLLRPSERVSPFYAGSVRPKLRFMRQPKKVQGGRG